jgi:glycine cleavage system H protein
LQINYCDFPDDALYDVDNRVWIRRLGEEAANVGITSVYSALAGRLSKVSFKPVGTVLRRGQSVATIESVRYFGVVRTPLSGTLIETNSVLTEQPKLANDSPYELGWLVKVETGFLAEEMSSLSDPASAEESLKAQINQLRVRCFKAYPDYEMWEIGVECAAVLVRLNELIERCALNEVIHVVSDDPTADIEMERWSDETGQLILESRKEGKLAHFIVKKAK